VIIYDAHEELCNWALNGIFGFGEWDGESKAIGLVLDGKIISATTYDNFSCREDGSFYSLDMGIFTVDKRWASKRYLKEIFAYPFIQLRVERVQLITSVHNEGVNSLVQRLGFTKEGLHRKAWHTGHDAFSWSMLNGECKWL
jgi:RimJ/RimL family protein N-acetyltransferase